MRAILSPHCTCQLLAFGACRVTVRSLSAVCRAHWSGLGRGIGPPKLSPAAPCIEPQAGCAHGDAGTDRADGGGSTLTDCRRPPGGRSRASARVSDCATASGIMMPAPCNSDTKVRRKRPHMTPWPCPARPGGHWQARKPTASGSHRLVIMMSLPLTEWHHAAFPTSPKRWACSAGFGGLALRLCGALRLLQYN